MDVVKIVPVDGGKRTQVVIEMSPAEAEAIVRLHEEGKLQHLAITEATIEPMPANREGEETTATARLKRSRQQPTMEQKRP